MNSILLWTGIVLIVGGWIALAWQAAKWMRLKNELERFPERRKEMLLRRNYCRFTIFAGLIIIMLSLVL